MTSNGISQPSVTPPGNDRRRGCVGVCYLVLIGEIDLLPELFLHVAAPQAVIGELLHEDAPEPVRAWASKPPAWIRVMENPHSAPAGLEKLQVGEQAAIHLAESIKADIILLDEKAARRVAADHGLQVTGLLGVLGEAATRGLVELAPAINRLTRTTFRCAPALLKSMLDRFGDR
jgi:predicted nucleic acid-binding protein